MTITKRLVKKTLCSIEGTVPAAIYLPLFFVITLFFLIFLFYLCKRKRSREKSAFYYLNIYQPKMKKTLLTIVMLFGCMLVGHAQELGVFISDGNGDTNVRNAPKGAVVGKFTHDDAWSMIVEAPQNGWWRIQPDSYADPEGDAPKFKASKNGYWIHYSVIGVGTRNYGGQRLSLRKSPSDKAAVVYSFTEELVLHPMDIKGDWVKVKVGNHEGWIEQEWLCDNPLTNCC